MIKVTGNEFYADTIEEAVHCLCASSLDIGNRVIKLEKSNKKIGFVLALLILATYVAYTGLVEDEKRIKELQKQVDELQAQRDIPVGE